MNLSSIDYGLVRLSDLAAKPLRALGQLESAYLREQLDQTEIRRPVFVTGLARAGTTILLEQLTRTNHFATHRYRDFPFLSVPFLWNRYIDLAGGRQEPVERPHRDRIQVTAESPEAYEEPIWQQFFPSIHGPDTNHRLDANTRNPAFEQFFRDHLRKMMIIRQRDRYLSKGNYNVARIEYLAKLFPDARFVIPVRHPVDHVGSLVRQHQLFQQYAEEDPRVGRYMQAAGHYEFGTQRRAIRIVDVDGDRTQQAWQQHREHVGYAIQWSQVYRFVDELRHSAEELSTRIHVVRFEDFCRNPRQELADVLDQARCPTDELSSLSFDHISAPPASRRSTEQSDEIWRETGLVAQLYGYEFEAPTLSGSRDVNLVKQ